MAELIQNRDAFLNDLASRLGTARHATKEPLNYVNDLPHETLADKTTEELIEIAKEKAATLNMSIENTTAAGLNEKIKEKIKDFGAGNVLLPNEDERFSANQLTFMDEGGDDYNVKYWQIGADKRDENIDNANKSNVAVAFADYMLAESSTVVAESRPGQGRALHFLPTHYISIVPKSKIVARSTQAVDDIEMRRANGEKFGSAINFISGPSNSGDIEMELVVGLHGPVDVVYLIVDDL